MKYTHFETLALVLGSMAIVASVFIAPGVSPQAAEVTAQLLLIVVLGCALHWGRNGGFLGALLALALYVAMRYPLLQSQGLSSEMLTMLGTRTITYAVVGVVGGELASRIKYVFAKLEDNALIDSVTGVYSASYAAQSILSGLGQWDRYHTEFSVVDLTLRSDVVSSLKSTQYKQLMKQAAGHLRSDIRMVDDLAFRSPGTFLVLLPGTPEGGARVVAERVAPALQALVNANDGLDVAVLSASKHGEALRDLAESLAPEAHEDTPKPPQLERRSVATDHAV